MAIRNYIVDDFRFLIFSEIYNKFNSRSQKRTSFNILESAIECFSKSGFQHTTLAMISKKAGVSKATILNHFSSLSEIQLTSFKYIRLLYQSHVLKEIESEKSAEVIFYKYFHSALKWPNYFPKHSTVWISFLHHSRLNSDSKNLNSEAVAIGFRRLKEIILMGIKSNEFTCEEKTIESIARSIHHCLTGLILAQATEQRELIEKEAENIYNFCLSRLKDG